MQIPTHFISIGQTVAVAQLVSGFVKRLGKKRNATLTQTPGPDLVCQDALIENEVFTNSKNN